MFRLSRWFRTFLFPSRTDLEFVTLRALEELVDRALNEEVKYAIPERVRHALRGEIESCCRRLVQEEGLRQIQARLDTEIRAVNFKPRVEAAAQQTLADALKRINFSGTGFEEFVLCVFRRLVRQRVGDDQLDPGPSD